MVFGLQDGNGWEFDVIVFVFIGGVVVFGGIGMVIGLIIGGFVMVFLNNGFVLFGVGVDVVLMIKGFVLLFVVGVDVWNKQQGCFLIIGFFICCFGCKQDLVIDMFDLIKVNYFISQKYEVFVVEEMCGKQGLSCVLYMC